MIPSGMHALTEVVDLTCHSPDFDAAYDVFSRDIPSPFLEEREFLRNRLRVRDEGPKSERERVLMQDGYTLHLIVAKEGEKVAGALYGHLISRIAPGNQAVGFVTYISVLEECRRRGIGTRLLDELRKHLEQDSARLTGNKPLGIVYEIEAEGKEEVKAMARKHHAAPLDIIYYQPALHKTTSAEPMHLWFQPFDPPLPATIRFRADFIVSLVTNLLTMEYVGPDLKGFDRGTEAYVLFLKAIHKRNEIGFLP